MQRPVKIFEIFNKNFLYQFIKYGFVGCINFVFTTLVYYLFLRLLSVNYLISFSISWLAGVILTFFINIKWVFKSDELRDLKRNFIKYLIVYITSFAVNFILLKVGVHYFGFDPFWYQFVLIPLVIIINFTGIKYWALK